jgi:hypothetical protein
MSHSKSSVSKISEDGRTGECSTELGAAGVTPDSNGCYKVTRPSLCRVDCKEQNPVSVTLLVWDTKDSP